MDEGDVHGWLDECVADGRFVLDPLVRHEWLPPFSLLFGPRAVAEIGRKALEGCPCWRRTQPAPGVIVLHLDEVDTGGVLRTAERGIYSDALAYLRGLQRGAPSRWPTSGGAPPGELRTRR